MGLNSDYKKKHKPLYEGQTKYHQGYFVPQLHPEKCLTYSPINNENIYRSGLEFNIFQIFDRCDNITRWATECLAVPYRVVNIDYCLKHKIPLTSPSALKNANYNIDAWIEITNGKETKKVFVEIKPYAQTLTPVPPPQDAKPAKFKQYNYECKTYIVNQAKWKAAKQFVEERGCEFIVITERYVKNQSRFFYELMDKLFNTPRNENIIVI